MSEGVDVAVIGGGILGLCTALELARAGKRVTLVEQEALAGGTTGHSFAWINATAKRDDRDYHALNAAGMVRYVDIARDFGERAIGLEGSGSLHWAHPAGPGGVAGIRHAADVLAGWGYPLARLDRTGLQALEPHLAFPAGAEGFLALADRWIDARRLAHRLASEIADLGGSVRAPCSVTGFLRNRQREIAGIETDRGPIPAATVVIAAGVATARLAALAAGSLLRLPLRAVPGVLVDVPTGPARWVNHVIYLPDAGGLHVRPTGDGGMTIGSDDIDAALAGRSDADLSQAPAQALERLATFIPGLPLRDLVAPATVRLGVRPMASDDRPIAGPLPGVAGVYLLATHSGITLGPLLGQLAAREIVSGEPAALLAPYRPSRFMVISS